MGTSGDEPSHERRLLVSVLGAPCSIEFDESVSDAAVASIRDSWSRCAIDEHASSPSLFRALIGPRPQDEGIENGVIPIAATTLAQLEETLTSTLTIHAIGQRKAELLMLHACGVADETGAVIALVAASGTGKTTASRALAREFRYVSDETVAIDDDGRVVAYPKPLSVKSDEAGVPKSQVAPEALGLRPLDPATPLRLSAIVLLDRREGIDEPYLEDVESFDAVCDLVPQTSYLSARPHPLDRLLTALAARGGARRVVYSEAEGLAPVIAELFASTAAQAPLDLSGYEDVADADDSVPADPTAEPSPGPSALRVRRRATDDAVLAPSGDLLLFVDNTIVRLTGIAPALWLGSREWTDIAGLVRVVESVIGTAPEGTDAAGTVASVVSELEQLSIVDLERDGGDDATAQPVVGIGASS